MARHAVENLVLWTLCFHAEAQVQLMAQHAMRNVSLWDNFRDPQEIGPYRSVYRSQAASDSCGAVASCGSGSTSNVCEKPKPSETTREWGRSTGLHWSYYDQAGWHKFVHPGGWPNECNKAPEGYAHPGQSPIDVVADTTTPLVPGNVTISLSGGFDIARPGLWVSNNGHAIGLHICGQSSVDCQATASFGTWPQVLRGADPLTAVPDEYYLLQFHVHWGSDNTKGSEHVVCGRPRAAELHMVFVNKRAVPSNRSDPDSGNFLTVLGTMIEGGAPTDNEAYSPLLDHVANLATFQGATGPLPAPLTLKQLLPQDYDSKFYTYPGSLTTPPCSQRVTWFVFENFVQVSDKQLEQLRKLSTLTDVRGHITPQVRAILFPFVAIALGALTSYFLSRYAQFVPYTVAMMCEGLVLDFLASFGRPESSMNPFLSPGSMAQFFALNSMQQSLDMWANIDGHLLLFIFLPVLLFGDAMAIDTHLFKRTFWQCLLLACPGVLLGTVATGAAAYAILPYNWPWTLALAFGSILSATDPVAVVALLKSVGASSKLTMQILGESLMNDGTAMVVFMLFFNMHMDWVQYDFSKVVGFFAQMALAGPALGLVFGFVAYFAMSTVTRKHNHLDSTIQTSITVFVAYLAFYSAEQESNVSGVLCTVTAALVLARFVWPEVTSHESMENVWHALEYFGNTLIFCLAGVITRRAIWSDQISAADFGWCLLMFVVMTIIRGVMVLFSFPLLKSLGYGTNFKDCCFMVWGGLRGAVGLALALYVRSALSGIDDEAGAKILFMVGGLAFLTLIVNATTAGPMLRASGMVSLTEAQRKMISNVQDRVKEHAVETYCKLCRTMEHDAVEALDVIPELAHLRATDKARPYRASAVSTVETAMEAGEHTGTADHFEVDVLESQLEKMTLKPDEVVLTQMRETFLRIVRAEYWELIHEGVLPRKSPAVLKLLSAISVSLDSSDEPLHDWQILEPTTRLDKGVRVDNFLDFLDKCLPEFVTWDNDLHYYLKIRRQEEAYHATVSFIRAHQHAQHKIALFFGDDPTPDTPEEVAIVLESARQVEEAKIHLSDMSRTLIHLIKTDIVASCVMDSMEAYVHKILEQAVLIPAEAEGVLKQIYKTKEDLRKVIKRKSKSSGTVIGQELQNSQSQSVLRKSKTIDSSVIGRSPSSQALLITPTNPQPSAAWKEEELPMPGLVSSALQGG